MVTFFYKYLNLIVRSVFSILLLFLITLSGCERNRYNRFEAWDADQDVAITEDEFGTIFRDAGYFRAWDENNDGFIDKTEWETGISTRYPEYNPMVSGYYDAWIGLANEDVLDEDAFTTSTYRLWDTNKDGKIDAVEYEEWYRDQ